MSDVSSNEELIEENTVSGNEQDPGEEENENYQSEMVYTDSSDYSAYFENLQNTGIFISALLYALILIVAFVGGIQNGKH